MSFVEVMTPAVKLRVPGYLTAYLCDQRGYASGVCCIEAGTYSTSTLIKGDWAEFHCY